MLAKLGRLQTSAKVGTIVARRTPANPTPVATEPAEPLGPGMAAHSHPPGQQAPANNNDASDFPSVRTAPPNPREETLLYWDNLLDIAEAADPANGADLPDSDEVPPEKILLVLPSNGTVADVHRGLELSFRKRKAKSLLNQIREMIAEKSFKYTDEIRNAPRKGVRTRGQTSVLELNRHLAFLCQVYSWNRARMEELGADAATLDYYKILEKADVKCSTAVLKPNKAGSTRLKLSWIWQSPDRRIIAGVAVDPENPEHSDPDTLLECR